MNWRTPFLNLAINLSQATVRDELKLLKNIEFKSKEEIQELHEQRLRALLYHAWDTTEYYHDILQECAVVKRRMEP